MTTRYLQSVVDFLTEEEWDMYQAIFLYYLPRGAVRCFFFESARAYFIALHTKNINIFMAKNIANIFIDILSTQKSTCSLAEPSKY